MRTWRGALLRLEIAVLSKVGPDPRRGTLIEPQTGQCDLSPSEVDQIRAALPPARTYGPDTVAEAARMIAAHQAGYLL